MISWSIENLLQPFVHCVPIHANLTNLDEIIYWANSHQMLVEQIAQRSTLSICDLLFHSGLHRDEEFSLEGIMRRYEQQFGKYIENDKNSNWH